MFRINWQLERAQTESKGGCKKPRGRTWDLSVFAYFISLTSSALDHSATAPPDLFFLWMQRSLKTHSEWIFLSVMAAAVFSKCSHKARDVAIWRSRHWTQESWKQVNHLNAGAEVTTSKNTTRSQQVNENFTD